MTFYTCMANIKITSYMYLKAISECLPNIVRVLNYQRSNFPWNLFNFEVFTIFITEINVLLVWTITKFCKFDEL